MNVYLNQRDLLFIVETLMPGSAKPERMAERLQRDETRLGTMLDEPRLFHRLMQQKELLPQISPWLFFTLLLRQAQRDLQREAFTVEQRGRQKVVLFDVPWEYALLLQKGQIIRFDYAEIDHCCELFKLVEAWLDAENLQRRGRVGYAEARLIRSRDIVKVVTEQLQSNETIFLHLPGVDEECDEARASLSSLPA